MSRGQVSRYLPNPQYLAAVNANAPTAVNPFATINDLAGLDQNWATADLNAVANRSHTIAAANKVSVSWNDGAGSTAIFGYGVNPTGFEAAGAIAGYFTTPANDIYFGAYDFGGDGYFGAINYGALGADEAGLNIAPSAGGGNESAAQLYHWEYATGNYYGFEANYAGERILSQSAGLNRLSALNTAAGMAFLSGAGATGYVGVVDQAGLSSWMNTVAGGWGGIYEGSGTVPTTVVATLTDSISFSGGTTIAKGAGITSATLGFTVQTSSGIANVLVQDDGQFATGAGTTASHLANSGHTFRSSNYGYGFAFYPFNATDFGLYVNGQGTTHTSVYASGSTTATGTVTAIRGTSSGTASTLNRGIYGEARNGSDYSIGGDFFIVGNASVDSSVFVAAVRGITGHTRDNEIYGAWFQGKMSAAGTVYTEDIVGISAHGLANSGNAGSTSKIVGGKFYTDGAVGTGDRIAIWVPSTGNNGTVVIGADSVGANASMVEVSGDIEVIGSANGLILESPTAGSYRVTVNDAGALVINSV